MLSLLCHARNDSRPRLAAEFFPGCILWWNARRPFGRLRRL